jgi:hypothetical protein
MNLDGQNILDILEKPNVEAHMTCIMNVRYFLENACIITRVLHSISMVKETYCSSTSSK